MPMVVTIREECKKDFVHIMGIIAFELEDAEHELLMHLTMSAKRSVITIININR